MANQYFSVHTTTCFDPLSKSFEENLSITVNRNNGVVVGVKQRKNTTADIQDGDIDLRYKIVMPGFVDAHTHIFLHSYE